VPLQVEGIIGAMMEDGFQTSPDAARRGPKGAEEEAGARPRDYLDACLEARVAVEQITNIVGLAGGPQERLSGAKAGSTNWFR
jgi:hypothetical protein